MTKKNTTTTTATTASETSTSETTASETTASETSTSSALALKPAAGGLALLVGGLEELALAEGLDAGLLPEQSLPSLALPTVQIDRPAAAPARWWSKRVEELSGYPNAAPSPRKGMKAGEDGLALGEALRCCLVSYRERWEDKDDAGAMLATPGYRPGARRRAQVLAAVPVADELRGARWELVTLTAGGLAAATLRAAYSAAVKARRAILTARKAPVTLAPLLPAELVVSTSEPKPVSRPKPGEEGATYVHAVVTASATVFQPAAGLGELLQSERATVEEWTAGVGWADVMTPGTPDEDDDIEQIGA